MIGPRLLTGSVTSSIRATSARRVIAPALRVSAQRIQSRQVHNRLQLPYPIEKGLGDFLPPAALKVVAEDYQQGLLDRLNEEVAGASCCTSYAYS
jgi:superoxide dismutase, Fe-Mn family